MEDEASKHEEHSLPVGNNGRTENGIAWINIFYGLLIAPATTLKVLSDPDIYQINKSAVLGSILLFLLASLTQSLSLATLVRQAPLSDVVAWSFGLSLAAWLLLATLLTAWSFFLNCKRNFWSALVVCGWGFAPMIFSAPIVLYELACPGLRFVLSPLPAIWFIILEFLAFNAILKLGKARTFAIVFVTPPAFIFASLFWVILWAMVASSGP